MNDLELKLANAPIVEAVVDFDCDMPPSFELRDVETQARECYRESYPKFRPQEIHIHNLQNKADGSSEHSVTRELDAYQFLNNDEKQLVQVRKRGYSFNRLAVYSSLDDYLPEIERTWKQFIALVSPVQIRVIRLRYVNRLPLPVVDGNVILDEYLTFAPRLPNEKSFTFTGFLNQHRAREIETGDEINIVLTAQEEDENVLPVIFDISTARAGNIQPDDWHSILATVQALRKLKNRIFKDSLTKSCLSLFQ